MTDFAAWLPAYSEYATHFSQGRCSPEPDGYYWILPINQISVDDAGDGLIIGQAGDGVTRFGLRKEQSGVWAHNAIDGEWRLCAPSIADLWQGWSNGSIVV